MNERTEIATCVQNKYSRETEENCKNGTNKHSKALILQQRKQRKENKKYSKKKKRRTKIIFIFQLLNVCMDGTGNVQMCFTFNISSI